MSLISKLFGKKEETAWYPIPFKKGKSYRVKQKVLGDFDTLEKGTILSYDHSGFSRYDGYIGFFFKEDTTDIRRWDIRDNFDPIKEAESIFEEIIEAS